jgi:transcriptional regulator GlxA family with amidase domain
VDIVTDTLKEFADNNYDLNVDDVAARHEINPRTLQRYFEATTSVTAKQAFQLIRIRKAIEDMIANPDSFDSSRYGYYDHSHFYKHLKAFLNNPHLEMQHPHLKLLKLVDTA